MTGRSWKRAVGKCSSPELPFCADSCFNICPPPHQSVSTGVVVKGLGHSAKCADGRRVEVNMYTRFLCQLVLLDNEVGHLNEITTTFPATSEAHTPCMYSVTKCIFTWPVCAMSQNVYLHSQYVQCHKMYIYMASVCK